MSQTFIFKTFLDPRKPIDLPAELLKRIPGGAEASIAVTVDEPEARNPLSSNSYNCFHKSYSPEDEALYEDYRPR